MRHIPALCHAVIVLAITLVSCRETKEADDHANWKERNSEYISNIASKCNTFGELVPQDAPKGSMFRLLSFRLDPETFGQAGQGSYVYCEVLDKGSDSIQPKFTDSIRINYRVTLIPTDNYPEGEVIDQSFKTPSLDPTVNIPYPFRVSGLIEGVTTAVMQMHCGDYWRLYIPQELGYGKKDHNQIPAYSTLIFDINLAEIAPTGQDLSPR